MKYQFILSYKATDSETVSTRTCAPIYGDDTSVSIERESGEWYYTRRLEGKITFVRDDYGWIMSMPFDGTFTLDIKESHDGGAHYYPYFDGTFSRANLDIDEDNRLCTISSFAEGMYKAIENGKDEDYDLMKIIPDADAKEVQGFVRPALAMVDYNTSRIDYSDMYCGSPITASGYQADESGYTLYSIIPTADTSWLQVGLYGESHVVMKDAGSSLNGIYTGELSIETVYDDYEEHYWVGVPLGELHNKNNCTLELVASMRMAFLTIEINLYDENGVLVTNKAKIVPIPRSGSGPYLEREDGYYPSELIYDDSNLPDPGASLLSSVECYFHYIYATLLTQSFGNADNVLDTGGYYKKMSAFNNIDGGLQVSVSRRTVEQPNGHRLIPGTGERGVAPQYFAPPDNEHDYIPLAENSWHYGSLWYTIVPSESNGLDDRLRYGTYRWTRCWELGTVLRRLLEKITDGKVTFDESASGSQFLYGNANPVTGHEPFVYLFTQKSNVMASTTSESASACPVRLKWFLQLLRNAFNCHYWLEKRDDGRYVFRVEHVEFFRRGGHYDQTLPAGIDLTTMRPLRNYRNYSNQLAKTYADQTNKYKYEMNDMVEKYTFSWQGDGGSDDFKGNPMFFKAGWIEPASSEDRQVDNIFADLDWLMLNAGSDTASAKNYEGVFLFAGYRRVNLLWKVGESYMPVTENGHALSHYLVIARGHIDATCDLWVKAPEGHMMQLAFDNGQTTTRIGDPITGTGEPQRIHVSYASHLSGILYIDLIDNVAQVVVYRAHGYYGNVYNVPNVANRLNEATTIQNGPLAWPWLQNEHLHYDIPAQQWSYRYDDLSAVNEHNAWEHSGTVKMVQKQTVGLLPVPEKATEDDIMGIVGIHTAVEGGKTGIITSAKVSLSSRNAKLTIVYDPVPQS